MKKKADKEEMWRTQHNLSGECHRAYSALLRSYASVLRQIEEHSKAEGALAPEWYDVLLALEYAPEGRLRVGELACRVTVSRSGLTRLVDRLEAAGLVSRQLHPSDRRSFEIILTPEGRAEREKTWPIYASIIARVFGTHYNDDEARQLADLLTRQFSGVGETCGAAACDGEGEETTTATAP
ncbi:MAG TPA: MarR family transcriptional regulator, partial [Abditibacteriaceae bacterium]